MIILGCNIKLVCSHLHYDITCVADSFANNNVRNIMKKIFEENFVKYPRNVLVLFINGALLAAALTNVTVIVFGGGNFPLGAQIVVTGIPLIFWFITMTFSHPWTRLLNHNERASIVALQAIVVNITWAIIVMVRPEGASLLVIILHLLVTASFISASYFNAFLTSKEEELKKEETKSTIQTGEKKAKPAENKVTSEKNKPKTNSAVKTNTESETKKHDIKKQTTKVKTSKNQTAVNSTKNVKNP